MFLRGLQKFNRGSWKQISLYVKTRTPTQVQSHAQKFFLRQRQDVKKKCSIHDLALDSPEMREVARQYGDRDVLFANNNNSNTIMDIGAEEDAHSIGNGQVSGYGHYSHGNNLAGGGGEDRYRKAEQVEGIDGRLHPVKLEELGPNTSVAVPNGGQETCTPHGPGTIVGGGNTYMRAATDGMAAPWGYEAEAGRRRSRDSMGLIGESGFTGGMFEPSTAIDDDVGVAPNGNASVRSGMGLRNSAPQGSFPTAGQLFVTRSSC